MILRELWGVAYQDELSYLHVYISQLRRKIEPDPAHPRYLLNEPGAGYRLVNPDTRPAERRHRSQVVHGDPPGTRPIPSAGRSLPPVRARGAKLEEWTTTNEVVASPQSRSRTPRSSVRRHLEGGRGGDPIGGGAMAPTRGRSVAGRLSATAQLSLAQHSNARLSALRVGGGDRCVVPDLGVRVAAPFANASAQFNCDRPEEAMPDSDDGPSPTTRVRSPRGTGP
jgi:hypothetical protein